MKHHDFTTEDADRLLGLADEFLSNWAEDAVQAGKPDPDYEQRNTEWETYRPLFENAPALFAGMKRAITALNSVPNFRTPEGIKSYELLSELDGIVANVPKVE